MPPDLKLEDDVRLEKIAFSEGRTITSDLSLTQCSVLLSQFFLLKRSKPKDSLLKEELMPYLDAILSNKNINWCLKSMALLERTKLEKNEKRGVERALMQMQTLVDNIPWPKGSSCQSRFDLFVSKKTGIWGQFEKEILNAVLH